ncbi:hypothetical protein R0137_00355 [Congregibacter brevis]|uniref:Uncharacterized protein n=1 Tax=Congregibacter brevis TaxID=3081201 RepID=A0ABZ0IEQ3_9GAMM|nr:hypothetical protein R0137_00355 [Congregibacter sp. IMCC45268]
MNSINFRGRSFTTAVLLVLTLTVVLVKPASAHLMMAQNGTLNIVDDGVYMVISVPITAFPNLDQDFDDEVSLFEFNSRRNDITAQVKSSLALYQDENPVALKDLRLIPVRPHSKDEVYLSQLIVMGKFEAPQSQDALSFELSLFGLSPEEHTMKITAKRPKTGQEGIVVLTPTAPHSPLFSPVVAQQEHTASLP